MKNTKEIDIVNGPLLSNIMVFAIPLMLSNFLQMLFNAADTIVVGKFAGEAALAAVGATGSIVFLLTSIFNGLGIGANVIIAKMIGAKEETKISKAVHTAMTLAIVGGILLIGIGAFFSQNLLELMDTPHDIIHLSKLYMQIYFSGSIFLLVYNFGAAILRSKGDTKRPLYFLMISGIINVVLNMFFVIVLKMSVAGVAIATVISQAISAILVWYSLTVTIDATHLDYRKLSIDFHMAKEIIRIGIPAGVQGIVFSLSNVVIQSSINSFGSSTIVAGNTAGGNIENFVYIGMMAFNQACITFTSQNLGARNYKSIRKIMWISMILTCVSALFIGIIVNIISVPLLGMYTDVDTVIAIGQIRLKYVALLLALNGILDVFVGSMRGMGHSSLPTILSIIGICGVRFLWVFFVFPQARTLEVLYACFPISWIITSIIQGILWHFVHKQILNNI